MVDYLPHQEEHLARRQRIDPALNSRLEEFEKRLFLVKIEYEKYFSGIELIEPSNEREDLRRRLRKLNKEPITNTRQRFRLRQLKARFNSMDMYWTRNLVMIERGTHPRRRFRADLHERERGLKPAAPARPRRLTAEEREDRAFRDVYDRYIETREKCGQSTSMGYESIRDVLKQQVRTIKSRYGCKSVRFRVTVEDGKAKVKAVPTR